MVSLGLDGRVHSQGPLSVALAEDESLAAELSEEYQEQEKVTKLPEENKAPINKDVKDKGKLVVAEEVAIGRVGWSACEYLDLIDSMRY